MATTTDTQLMSRLGHNVARLRTEQDLSKTTFAQMSGMSRPTLNKIEDGFSDTRLSYVQRLGDALCVDPLLLLQDPDGACEDTNTEMH